MDNRLIMYSLLEKDARDLGYHTDVGDSFNGKNLIGLDDFGHGSDELAEYTANHFPKRKEAQIDVVPDWETQPPALVYSYLGSVLTNPKANGFFSSGTCKCSNVGVFREP